MSLGSHFGPVHYNHFVPDWFIWYDSDIPTLVFCWFYVTAMCLFDLVILDSDELPKSHLAWAWLCASQLDTCEYMGVKVNTNPLQHFGMQLNLKDETIGFQ